MSADHDVWAPRPVPDTDSGPPPVEARIRFGPLDHQWFPPEIAARILTIWHESQPAQMGTYIARAYTGEAPQAGRGRKS